MKRFRAFSAWLSSVSFCCCCIFPNAMDRNVGRNVPNPPAVNNRPGPGADARINAANYEKIRNGMTIAEVQGILGPGEEIGTLPGDQEREFEWVSNAGGRERVITVIFENGRVVSKSLDG